MRAVYRHGSRPETRPVKRPSQPLPVSGLPSSVEAQISATHASINFSRLRFGSRYCILTLALHWPHMVHVDLRKYAHLKFTVSGRSKQASKHR